MPPYDSLNLGAHCGDNPEHVEENRKRLFAAGNLPSKPVWLEQVHGKDVLKLTGEPYACKRADASYSNTPGTVCAVMTADCLPVLFCNRAGNRIKVLLWDGTGVWLCQRRLHQGKFVWPKSDERCFVLTPAQWNWLVAGVNWQRLSALPPAHLKV